MDDNMNHQVTDQTKELRDTIDVLYNNIPVYCPRPNEFHKFVQWACIEYHVDFKVIVTRAVQEAYVSVTTTATKKSAKQRKMSKLPSLIQDQGPDSNEDDHSSELDRGASLVPESIVTIETVYDANENLVQLKLLKNKEIPRKVMQIIALTIPYQKKLTSITINSGLRVDCLYEISKFLPNSQITELCFDGTFLSKANYHILLTHGKLKHLSLARCSINDDIVKMIADQIRDPNPAARVLSALNLSTNRITDIGANYLAEVLRSNRQLCYLNLAGNMITDEGGVSILNTLQKFTLLPHELLEDRTRYVAYLKKKNDIISAFVKEMQTATFDKNANKRKSTKRAKLENHLTQQDEIEADNQIIQERAECMAERMLGMFDEPFSLNNTKTQNGVAYCLGNNTLCCLNFAYNNLTYISLKKLREVLLTQQSLNRIPRGLIKVVIEGNLMPVACKEFKEIDNLLGSGIKSYKNQLETATKKKLLTSRSTIK